jgi:hypothetical protein
MGALNGMHAVAGDTFGKAIAGILAHSKGRSIGIYEDKEEDEEAGRKKAAEEEKKGVRKVDVFNMKVTTGSACCIIVLETSLHELHLEESPSC